MSGIVRFLAVMSVVIGLVRTAIAEDSTPRVSIMQAGANELLADVKYIVGLTDKKEQKQWPVLKDYFDVFLEGIDRTKPIRIDLLLDVKDVRYRSSFPVTSLKVFRDDNLDTFGIDSKRRALNFYELKMNKDPFGWMRYRRPYAIIAEERGDVPRHIADPLKAIAPVLAKKYDLAADIRNTADGQAKRKESFKRIRTELLAAVKQKQDEATEDFELRKTFTTFPLDEAERFFVEASQITLGWTTDVREQIGRLDLELAPIANTDLEKAVKLLAQEPSDFANIKKGEHSILSGRINHPLDGMRTENLLEMWDKLSAQLKHKAEVSAKSTDTEKTNRKKVIDLFFDMLKAGTQMGVVDGFIEVEEHSVHKHTVVAGIKAADGNAMIEIIKLLEAAKMGQQVQAGFDKQGDVSIHKVVLPDDKQDIFKDFLADDGIVYVGTSPETVWFAAGQDALEALKKAVDKVAQPNAGKADDPFVDLSARVGPWLKLRDRYVAKAGGKKTTKTKTKKKTDETETTAKSVVADLTADRDALRKLALQAFQPDDDTIELQIKRIDNRVEGRLLVRPGVLRFVGKLLAKFSKENLDEE